MATMADYVKEYSGLVFFIIGFFCVKFIKKYMYTNWVQPGYDAAQRKAEAGAEPQPKGALGKIWDKLVALDAWMVDKLAIDTPKPPAAEKKD
jgi:hypothetical protein